MFTDIYRDNKWRGQDSVSGKGSGAFQTRIITKELPAVFSDFGISKMLDIPCGDFHWMKTVDLSNIDYTGADIVDDLIQKNIGQYGRDGARFQKLNLTIDKLPKVDLIVCRDCLVHFSFEDIFYALDNVCNSQSKYFLTTTFTEKTNNYDITTGRWRPLNLELAPFMLPRPLKIINEGCTETDDIDSYTDKSLGLWSIADLREALKNQRS
ncbi:MAG: class I SAM-dependent methyltransferase [Porticoccaceae bacterium]|nr:class I SAM-dependent methyltransferase [Porticoccaceae bacterium]